jgi:hypothetical protein
MKTDAVMESADFGPAHEGESFVLVTMRVPRDTRVGPGVHTIEFKEIGKPVWAEAKDEKQYAKNRERSDAAASR